MDPREFEHVAGIVQADILLARLPDLPVTDELRDHIEKMLRGIIAST